MRPSRAAALLILLAAPVYSRAQLAESACTARPTTITATTPAVIPIELNNNHIFIKVCANGHPLSFILDTGAAAAIMDLNTARRMGYEFGSSMSVGGAGAGRVAGAQLKGARVAIDGTDIEQPLSTAIDISRLPAREGHAMDGILGAEFIRRYAIVLDYVNSQIRLYDARGFRYDGPGTSLPIQFINDHPHVEAGVRLADGETIKGRMIVDVGSSASLGLTKPWVEEHHLRDRIGPTVRRRGGGGVGGPTMSETGRVAALTLGGLEVSRPITALFGDSAGVLSGNGAWIGNIGGEILSRFTVTLDYQHKRMIFEPHAGTNTPFEADMAGAGLILNDSLTAIVVDYLVPGMPAAEAGLMVGDSVMTIDGQPASAALLRETRKRFRRDGERIVLRVKRGEETKEITFTTRRLI
jgi:hypothetical protein